MGCGKLKRERCLHKPPTRLYLAPSPAPVGSHTGNASVAQLVEQLTLNQLVLGSSPSGGTTGSQWFANGLLRESFFTWTLFEPTPPAEDIRFASGFQSDFLPVRGRETSRGNQIPNMTAHLLQKMLGGKVWKVAYKLKGDGHNTNAAQNERAKREHEFAGVMPPSGSAVVLVDDTFTTGNTITAFIDALPESPVAVVTLARSRYGVRLKPTPEQRRAALDKMGG